MRFGPLLPDLYPEQAAQMEAGKLCAGVWVDGWAVDSCGAAPVVFLAIRIA